MPFCQNQERPKQNKYLSLTILIWSAILDQDCATEE